MIRHRLPLLVATLCILLLVFACRTTPRPDEVPTEGVQPTQITSLLPDTTRAVVAVKPAVLERILVETFGVSDEDRAAFWNSELSIIQDVFGPEAVPGIDRELRHMIALSTAGHEDLLRHLRAGAPLPSQGILPDGLHLRMIVVTADAEGVARGLEERCVQRSKGETCEEYLRLTPYTEFLTVDFLMGGDQTAEASQRLDEHLAGMSHPTTAPTAAWLAFQTSDAPISAHASMTDLFELAAMEQAQRFLGMLRYTEPQDAEAMRDVTSATISQLLLFDSPEVAETHDLMLGFEERDGTLFFDGVGSLTPYGESVEAAGRVAAPQSFSPTLEGIIDLRWAFDLARAVEAARLPHWAVRPEGMNPNVFAERLSRRQQEVGVWANLAYLQYSISMLRAGFDTGADSYLLVADARTLRGLTFRGGTRPDVVEPTIKDIIGTLALISGTESSLEDVLEGYLPFLGQAGIPYDTRMVGYPDRLEYLVSVGAEVDETFHDEKATIEPGTAIFVDLARLFALAGAVMPERAEEDQQGAFVARHPLAHYSSRTLNGQWLLRLQLGPDDKQLLQPVSGAEMVAPVPRSACSYRAAQESVDVLTLVASVTPAEGRKIAGTFVRELQALAEQCPEDEQAQEQIEWLIEIWQARAG